MNPLDQHPTVIYKADVKLHKEFVLIYHEINPNTCPCGWYIWKKICGCLHLRDDYKCGGRSTATGRPAFCHTPAPVNQVTQFVVNTPCSLHVAPFL